MSLVTRRAVAAIAAVIATAGSPARAQRGQDWPVYGGDQGATKYSPLADINRQNVARLALAWTWSTGEVPRRERKTRPGNFEGTPLVMHDTMYLSTSYNRVVALDATTGRLLWQYDPHAYDFGQVPNGTGFVHRGVATWTDGKSRRVFLNSRWMLIALNGATGALVREFGDTGVVDLTTRLGRPVNRLHYTETSPPVVWRDLVIVGNGVADKLVYPNDPPGDVQAYDVRTGRRVWSWSAIPHSAASEGARTWEDESWRTAGHTNVWAPMSVDDARGLLYLPESTPSNDWYGGARLGDDLFAEAIVCLDAATGKKKWYFQTVHHGLWDYDLPAPPVLARIRPHGHGAGPGVAAEAGAVDAVAVPTKTGFVFVFDRVTGRPIWPIQERPVPASDVPGERAAPTQPVPTWPLPFAKQGFGPEDVIDYTPELKARALRVLGAYRAGPMFTPPSVQGTVVMPGAIGGAGWGAAALDPATGVLYVKATNSPALYKLYQPPRSDTLDAAYTADLTLQLSVIGAGDRDTSGAHQVRDALPINKPPYGTLTAIDLNTGDHVWQVALGDSPNIRNHPSVAGLHLPPLGVAGAPGPIVTAGGLLFLTGGGSTLYAIDKTTGGTLWSADLGQRGYAVPMTYRSSAGKQYVAIATGGSTGAKLMVFGLEH